MVCRTLYVCESFQPVYVYVKFAQFHYDGGAPVCTLIFTELINPFTE